MGWRSPAAAASTGGSRASSGHPAASHPCTNRAQGKEYRPGPFGLWNEMRRGAPARHAARYPGMTLATAIAQPGWLRRVPSSQASGRAHGCSR